MGVEVRLARNPFRPRLRSPEDDLFHGLLTLFTVAGALVLVWTLGAPPRPAPPDIVATTRVLRVVLPPPAVDPAPPDARPAPAPPPTQAPTPVEPDQPIADAAPADPPEPARRPAPRRRTREEILAEDPLLAGLIATRGRRSRGSTSDPYSGGESLDDQLDAALAQRTGVQVAQREFAGARRASQGRADAGIGDLRRARGGGAALAEGPTTATVDRRSPQDPAAAGPTATDQSRLARVVRTYARQIKACYEQRLKLETGLSGRIAVRWAFDRGAVTDAEITDNTTRDAELEVCVIRRVRRWRVPEDIPAGEVETPYVLTPG